MRSEEIRNHDPIAVNSWESMKGIGEQLYELTKQVRECASQLADISQNQRDAYNMGQAAMVALERNERERGKGEDGGECVIGLASTVCAKGTLGCSKHRTPLPTEAPREDFPVPAKKPQPQAGDVIAQALDAWFEVPNNGEAAHKYKSRRMTSAAQVIVRALLEETGRVAIYQRLMMEDGETMAQFSCRSVRTAARNLGLEVRG